MARRPRPKLIKETVPDDCPVRPKLLYVDDPNRCDRCGKELTGRRKRWCSDKCAGEVWREFADNHYWSDARDAALKRDNWTCRKCGRSDDDLRYLARKAGGGRLTDELARKYRLEVNHIVQAKGRHSTASCIHHLSNLETLCRFCHLKVTASQREEASLAERRRYLDMFPSEDEL